MPTRQTQGLKHRRMIPPRPTIQASADESSQESASQQSEDEQQMTEDERQRREAETEAERERRSADAAAADPCVPESLPGTGADMARTISSGGNEYEYLVYVPGGLDGPAPLVLNFHGLGGDGPGQARYTAYRELAEREGFVVIHPSGLLIDGSQGFRSWELAQEAGLNPQLDAERDDLQFVRDLLDEVMAHFCIDSDRVYSTGMSNGGGFSSRLACELADRIAAAFAVTLVTHPEDCAPSRPLAFAAVHGTDDDIVPFYGTGESPVCGPRPDRGRTRGLPGVLQPGHARRAGPNSLPTSVARPSARAPSARPPP